MELNLENLSIEELETLLQEEKVKTVNLRNKIKTKMLKVSAELKRYNVSTGPAGTAIDYQKNVKKQLIEKIKAARQYNSKLTKQWDSIKDLTGLSAIHAVLIGFDNIDTSKQVEMLRNLGYSEAEIDIILAEIRGDEEYDELKEKAADIIVNYYIGDAEEVDENDIGVNPYL